MKKLLIFDLKNTLVYQGDRMCSEYEKIIAYAQAQRFELLLYTMNEPWSFRVLEKYAGLFAKFQLMLLTTKKKKEDIKSLIASYNTVAIVGDGPEEQAIAKYLGLPFFLVRQELTEAALRTWLVGLSK